MNQTVLGIDIGSTKICAIIAEVKDGMPHVIGNGVSKSQGLKKGVITNIELASKAIKQAITDAKRMAGTDFTKAVVSISGAYTKSLNSTGIVNIPNNEIGIKEINRVMQTALYNANVLNEYDVVHALPYNFKVDEQDFIDDPLGMNGSRLEVSAHIVTAQKSSLNNLKKAIKSAGVDIQSIVLCGYASSIATLNADERELGVVCVDMGGSTCNLIVHAGNSIRYNDFLGVGSNHITNDLSMALHTPLSAAEKVKVDYGTLIKGADLGGDSIELPESGNEGKMHQVSLEVVHNVIYARVEETLMILAKSLEKSSLKDQIGAGVVLTGGLVKLNGIRELASAIFDNMPVRVASPQQMEGLFEGLKDPSNATCIGLIMYGAGQFTNYEIDSERKLRFRNERVQETQSFEDVAPNVDPAEANGDMDMATLSIDQGEIGSLKGINIEEHSGNSGSSKFWRWLNQLF